MMTLETYLRAAALTGVVDHTLRAQFHLNGRVTFYVRPAAGSGRTLDLEVIGNTLTQDPNVEFAEFDRQQQTLIDEYGDTGIVTEEWPIGGR